MKCQALGDRNVTIKECAKAQSELPTKFCEGCNWFEKKISELANMPKKQERSDGYVPGRYVVYISKTLKAKLIEEARRNNMQPTQFITKLLAQKLGESFQEKYEKSAS